MRKLITAAAMEEEDAEYQDAKVLEARVAARLREAQADMLRIMLGWHRDLLLLTHGTDPGQLQFPAEEDALRRQAAALNPSAAMQQIQAVEGAIRKLDRNLPPRAVFEAAMIDQTRAVARAAKEA
jgi:hypothetical protein